MTPFRGLGALTWAFIIQAGRSKPALFWNLLLPLIFLVGLSYVFGGGEAERVTQIIPGVLTINLLSASVFGLALHMVSLRERGMYRRLRATPANASTLVVAHGITAVASMLAAIALQLLVARVLFGVVIRGSLLVLLPVALIAAMGLIPLGLLIGGSARDMRSAPMISNLVFFPMMFLSGAAMPLFLLPEWIRKLAPALPATYSVEALQAVILRGESLNGPLIPLGILLLTVIIGVPMAAAAFRWETDSGVNRRQLGLALVCLAAVYGAAMAFGVTLKSARVPVQETTTRPPPAPRPPGQIVLSGMTILDGLGGRIQRGKIVIDGNRILEVSNHSDPPEPGSIDLTGMYVIPGLIDSHVHLGGSAGGAASSTEFSAARLRRDLQVYLAWGVTSIVSLTDDPADLNSLREAVTRGMMRAPRPFFSGPGLTAPRGHPAVYFRTVPGLAPRITRQTPDAEAAVAAVRELATNGVDLIKFYLDAGRIGETLPVLPEPALLAGMQTARELGLSTTVHVDSDANARMAIAAGATSIEHVPPDLSAETIETMVAKGVTLTPTLVASHGLLRAIRGEPTDDPDAKRWVDGTVLASLVSPQAWTARVGASEGAVEYYTHRHQQTLQAARRAVAGGVSIVAGSDAGNPGAFHGLGLIRELELLVEEAGMSPEAALMAATGTASRRLGKSDVGRIAPGAFADLVILAADPTKDIHALRRIRAVYFSGRQLERETLLSTSPGAWMPRAAVVRR